MDIVRPLRDVFPALARIEDPLTAHRVLRSSGHADLGDELLAEAIRAYAETAPLEIAERLSTFVTAHSSVPFSDLPDVDASGWLDAIMPTWPAEHRTGGQEVGAWVVGLTENVPDQGDPRSS